jgi:hypothetical protein
MKLNRNKKILIGLLCLGVGLIFLTFVGKYFGNVVEGLSSGSLKNYNYGMDRAVKYLKDAENVDHKIINDMKNPSNVTNFIEKTKTAKNDISQAYSIIVPLREGNKNRKKKSAPPVLAIPVITTVSAPPSTATPVLATPAATPVATPVPLSADEQKAIDDALLKANTSFNEAIKFQTTAYTDNPIEPNNKSLYLLTDGDKIIYIYSAVLGGLRQSIDALNGH